MTSFPTEEQVLILAAIGDVQSRHIQSFHRHRECSVVQTVLRREPARPVTEIPW